jgi:glycosyltransferase involved in cell wall biosynthesis
MGHEAVLLPLYLPLTLDEPAASPDSPVFFGGLNVYLQQQFSWFRRAPRWMDWLLDHPKVLKFLGRFSGMTRGAEIGELTLSMLRGEEGSQSRELEKLVEWLRDVEKPHVVWLSTALMVGVARRIREELGIPVLCSLQGEDSFLDGLPEPWRSQCWAEMGARVSELDGTVAPSAFFGGLMSARLGLGQNGVHVIPNGIGLDGYGAALNRSSNPVVGYLARLTPGKGLCSVIDAFLELHRRGRVPDARLVCVGTMIETDAACVEQQKGKLREAGLEGHVQFEANVSRERKIELLRGFSLLSVPALYGEAFGLYLLEAMACGVPAVQPRTAAFTEIVEETGGGILVEDASSEALAEAWEALLLDPSRANALGHAGLKAVRQNYSMRAMAERFVAFAEERIKSEKIRPRN